LNADFGECSGGFLVAHSDSYPIGLYSWTGQLVRVLSRNDPAPKLSPKRIAAAVELVRRSPIFRGGTSSARIADLTEKIKSEKIPILSAGNTIGVDRKGRIWALGIAGDFAFADVFAETAFIGRIGVPCPGFEGRWCINGQWLAMNCQSSDANYDGDAVVKLFKIDGALVIPTKQKTRWHRIHKANFGGSNALTSGYFLIATMTPLDPASP